MADEQIAADAQIVETTPEISEREQLGEIWDKYAAEGIEDTDEPDTPEPDDTRDEKGRFKGKEPADNEETADPEQETDVTEEKADETEQAETEDERPAIFGSLPREVREAWDKIPEEARDGIMRSHMAMSNKAMEAGRMAHRLAPINAALDTALRDLPSLAKMQPEQLMQDVYELAKTRDNLNRDPVNTILSVARSVGAMDKLAQVFGGQPQQQQVPQVQALQQHIAQLETQVRELSNPDIIRGTVGREIATERAMSDFAAWSAGKEHLGTVEPYLPTFIEMAQQNAAEGASNVDILETAYQMALGSFGLRAAKKAAAEAPDPNAPRRSEAALRAKSVNVTSRGSKPAPMSEREELAAAYERAMRK